MVLYLCTLSNSTLFHFCKIKGILLILNLHLKMDHASYGGDANTQWQNAAGRRPRYDFGISAYYDSVDNRAGSSIVGDSSALHAPVGSHLRNAITAQYSSFGGNAQRPLPPSAAGTLYVKGLPTDCLSREVQHIFRPFRGYKEVRLAIRESRHTGKPIVLCFVDFETPAHAATAMNALQGYKLDELNPNSCHLDIEFSRQPGSRSRRDRAIRHLFICGTFSSIWQYGFKCDSLQVMFQSPNPSPAC